LDRSLSALLAVRNVESTLGQTVLEMLDILPELTRRLEIVIVDDASRDATLEVADELAGQYPQLVIARHAHPRGRAEAITTALQRSSGEVILLGDEDCGLALDQVGKMWRALDNCGIVLGRPAPVRVPDWRGRQRTLVAWRERAFSEGRGGLAMGYRRLLAPLASSMIDQRTLRARLARLGTRWHEVEIGPKRPRLAPHRVAVRASLRGSASGE
jgi:glycosyltransferase involved in cell wall biosynthesis